MTERPPDVSTEPNVVVVENLLYALRDKNLDALDAVLADDLIYQNVGLPTIRGRARARKLFAGMQRPSMGFDVKFHRSAVEGNTVLNERTDVISLGPVRIQFWVCGVFEVHDGKVTLWRDYFDFYNMAKGLIRGVIGAVLPAARPTF